MSEKSGNSVPTSVLFKNPPGDSKVQPGLKTTAVWSLCFFEESLSTLSVGHVGLKPVSLTCSMGSDIRQVLRI